MTIAVVVFDPSWILVAVMVSVPGYAGEVYRPEVVIVPSEADHLMEEVKPPVPVIAEENCAWVLVFTVSVLGEIVMEEMAGELVTMVVVFEELVVVVVVEGVVPVYVWSQRLPVVVLYIVCAVQPGGYVPVVTVVPIREFMKFLVEE